jgi:hypothetical protein
MGPPGHRADPANPGNQEQFRLKSIEHSSLPPMLAPWPCWSQQTTRTFRCHSHIRQQVWVKNDFLGGFVSALVAYTLPEHPPLFSPKLFYFNCGRGGRGAGGPGGGYSFFSTHHISKVGPMLRYIRM